MIKRAFLTGIALMVTAGMAFAGGEQETLGTAEVVAEEGLLVTGVLEDSAASQAGLQRGDVILSADGQALDTALELREIISGMRAGDDLELSVRSGDETRSVAVTLDERYNMPPLGVQVQAGPGLAGRFGRPGPRGSMHGGLGPGRPGFGMVGPGLSPAFRILEVADDSPADQAGIEAGYIVTGIEGELVAGETITVSYIENAFQQQSFRGRGGPRDGAWADNRARDDEPEVETVSMTVGERDGQAYLGVRYAPVGGFGNAPVNDGWNRGGRPGPGGMMGRSGGRGGRGW